MPEELKTEGRTTVGHITSIYVQLSAFFQEFNFGSIADKWDNKQVKGRLDCYKYVVGEQLSQSAWNYLTLHRRPTHIWNLLMPQIQTLAGYVSQNMKQVIANPTMPGDEEKADIETKLIDWASRRALPNAYHEIAKAVIDAAIGRIGWINPYWDFRLSMQGRFRCKAVDPFRILFDPEGSSADGSDWKYLITTAFYTPEEIIATYAFDNPELIEKINQRRKMIEGRTIIPTRDKPQSWINRLATGLGDIFGSRQRIGHTFPEDFADTRLGMYRVIEFEDRRHSVDRIVYDATTKQFALIPEDKKGDSEFMAFKREGMVNPIVQDIPNETMYRTAIAPGLLQDEVLTESPLAVQTGHFSKIPIMWHNFHPDILKTKSLIDTLIDPQDSFNKRRWTYLDYLMRAVNKSYIMDRGSVHPDDMEAWKSGETGVLKMKRSGKQVVPEEPSIQEAGLRIFAEEDRELMTAMGINKTLQGQLESKSAPASLFAQQVAQSEMMLEWVLNNNLPQSLKAYGEQCIAYHKKYFKREQWIRVFNRDFEPEWLLLNEKTLEGVRNDMTVGKFDVDIDTARISGTIRKQQMLESLQLAKIMPAELVDWISIIKQWDSPLKYAWIKHIQAMLGVQDESQRLAMVQQMVEATGQLPPTNGAGEQAGSRARTAMTQPTR